MKYTAINIGPIVKTLSLARRPRELWSASYLFSYLMKCIIDKIPTECTIIAPIKGNENTLVVGLYPDRLYLSHEVDIDVKEILNSAWEQFRNDVFPEQSFDPRDYFNLMYASIELEGEMKNSVALKELNSLLDKLELCVFANNPYEGKDVTQSVLNLICKKNASPLVKIVQNEKKMPMETLAELAAVQLKKLHNIEWKRFSDDIKNEAFQGDPYDAFKGLKEYKSYHRYFCVVQADGDNMGKLVTSSEIDNAQLENVSRELWNYGLAASSIIEEYGGKAIYAGGDDLLFIAPLVGRNNKNIFELFEDIEKEFEELVKKVPQSIIENKSDRPSLSFGVAMAYYKYPLYEVLGSAIDLLFDVAKGGIVKNKVAWKLEKNSGETFSACYSKRDTELDAAYKELIKHTTNGELVSVAAHKLKENEVLLMKCLNADMSNEDKETPRLDSFFKTILEATNDNAYFNALKKLIVSLYSAQDIKCLKTVLYAMMRTAKFIKGEDTKI